MTNNLFAPILQLTAQEEHFSTLLNASSLRIERIVSTGQSSPPNFWYDQTESEWVAILQGEAKLLFAGESQARHLQAGDFIDIPAHCRHRIEWTPPDQETIWLAVFYAASTE